MTKALRYADQVKTPIDGKNAYNFNINYRLPLGYITQLDFTGSGTKLTADTEIADPENPDQKVKVLGVMDGLICWEGGPADSIEIIFRVSSKNKAIIRNCVTSLTGGADVDAAWVLTDYDSEGKKYFKKFHTDGKAVKLVITNGTKVDVNEIPNTDVIQPQNYTVAISLTAKGEAGKQELFCAEDISHKVTRQLGGIGA